MAHGIEAEVLAVCVGGVGELNSSGRTIRSAFIKTPQEGRVRIRRKGVEGDEHVYEGHGGNDMAVLAYPVDHYPYWRNLGIDLPEVGAFGENLTIGGLTEADVRIGDTFEVGTCVLQVSRPRAPCYKIAARYGRKDISIVVQETGFTGFLLRVHQEGHVAAGDVMTLVGRDASHDVTVAEAGRILNVDRNDLDGARRLLEVEALSADLKRMLESRIARRAHLGLDLERLYLSGQVET